MLYPLIFKPIYKEKIWGGNALEKYFNRSIPFENCGESWEISGVQDNISVVENGFLKGNNLQELIEVYMGDIVGEWVYKKFGIEFPLLIKFIDAKDILSLQVHPGDEYARKKHKAYGKTEMWYVIDAEANSTIITGFKKKIDKQKLIKHLEENTVIDVLNFEKVKPGDVFFIPSGRVHAIGKGVFLAEIQQVSDITYRLYDWNRKDQNGNLRELHLDHALDVIDFEIPESYRTNYLLNKNTDNQLIYCEYFRTNLIDFDTVINKNKTFLDSFIIYMCLEGTFRLAYNNEEIVINKGQTVLVPAVIENFKLIPEKNVKVLEVFLDK
ncbi:MAG: class I mannose-6-phosphate isomerase [Marinilabiliales bacterium]